MIRKKEVKILSFSLSLLCLIITSTSIIIKCQPNQKIISYIIARLSQRKKHMQVHEKILNVFIFFLRVESPNHDV